MKKSALSLKGVHMKQRVQLFCQLTHILHTSQKLCSMMGNNKNMKLTWFWICIFSGVGNNVAWRQCKQIKPENTQLCAWSKYAENFHWTLINFYYEVIEQVVICVPEHVNIFDKKVQCVKIFEMKCIEGVTFDWLCILSPILTSCKHHEIWSIKGTGPYVFGDIFEVH